MSRLFLWFFALAALPLFAAETDKFSAEFLGVSEDEITHGETKTQVLEGFYTSFPGGTGSLCFINVSVETARTLAEYQESWLRMECDIRTDSCNKGSMDWIIAARNVVRLPMPAFEVRRTVIPAGAKPGEPFQLFTVFSNTSQPPRDYLTHHWCSTYIVSGKDYSRGNLREFDCVFQASDVVPAGYCNFWMEQIPGYAPATGQELVQNLSLGIASLNQDDRVGLLKVKEDLAALLAQAGREQGQAAGAIQGDSAARQQEPSLQISELSIKPSEDEPDYMELQWRITPPAGAAINVPVAYPAVPDETEPPHYACAFRLYGVDADGKRYGMEVKRPFGMYQGTYDTRMQELPAAGAEVHLFARLTSRFTPALQTLQYEVLSEKGILNTSIPISKVYNVSHRDTPFGAPSAGFRMRARIS